VAGGRQQLVAIRQPLVQCDHQHAQPQRLLAATRQLAQQLGQLAERQAAQVGDQVGAEPRFAVEPIGVEGVSGHRRSSPEEIHYHVVVREQLREMLKRERKAATPGLRPLAQRVGVL
jgi:hypothetical protein